VNQPDRHLVTVGDRRMCGGMKAVTTTMACCERHARTFTLTAIHIGEKKYVVNIAYILSNSSVIIFTGYAGVLQFPSELHITTEMADKFFQRIKCELNLTTKNANELVRTPHKPISGPF
jgi:hypothetical protein